MAMNILENIKILESEHYILVTLCFLAMFSPGMLCLLLFFPAEFMEISTLKLVLISFAVAIPLAIPHIIGAGVLLATFDASPVEKIKMVPVLGTIIGALVATFCSYFLIAIAYLIGIDIKTFVLMVLLLEAVAVVAWFRSYKYMRRRNAPNKQINQG